MSKSAEELVLLLPEDSRGGFTSTLRLLDERDREWVVNNISQILEDPDFESSLSHEPTGDPINLLSPEYKEGISELYIQEMLLGGVRSALGELRRMSQR